ncbi:MAG: hypothetical protein HZR80_06365 [Candidatus Heimdallarchaeota archaeon]
MTNKISLEQKMLNTKKITELILDLPVSFSLPNGWGLKELLLHLWSWDDEFTKICEGKMNDSLDQCEFEFKKMNMDYVEWNDYVLEKMSNLTLDEARQKYKETRYKIITLYEKLIKFPETVEDEKSFYRTDRILDLWQHDKQHLKAGGIKIDF